MASHVSQAEQSTRSSDTASAQVFELNMWRAWGAVATTAASVALSVYLIAISPWYLLPLAWAFAGTAWTGVRLRWVHCFNML